MSVLAWRGLPATHLFSLILTVLNWGFGAVAASYRRTFYQLIWHFHNWRRVQFCAASSLLVVDVLGRRLDDDQLTDTALIHTVFGLLERLAVEVIVGGCCTHGCQHRNVGAWM